jgi:hypothetical protein
MVADRSDTFGLLFNLIKNNYVMKKSKEFMLLFRFSPDVNSQPSATEMAEQQQQWGAFIGNLAMQEKLVSTHQLGFEGRMLNAKLELSEGIHMAGNETVGGNLVITANSIDEATEIGKACPILMMGGSVEVRDILPMD